MFLRNLVIIAFFTAFIYVIGLVPSIQLPFINIPIVLQSIGIFLAASILGVLGVFSIILFLLLALLGFPVLTGGRGGLSVFIGPTGGFLIGYILSALIIGILVYRLWPNINFFRYFFCNFIGLIVMYIPGILWYAYTTSNIENITSFINTTYLFLVFIPGDIIKIFITCYIAVTIKKYYPIIEKRNIEDYTDKYSKKQLSIGH